MSKKQRKRVAQKKKSGIMGTILNYLADESFLAGFETILG
jgi:hypothetical protein